MQGGLEQERPDDWPGWATGAGSQRPLSNFTRRLPYHSPGSTDLEAGSFIADSYLERLSLANMFNLQCGGRDGIIDRSLETATTGELQRKLTKALENLVIGEDGSVRDPAGNLIWESVNFGCSLSQSLPFSLEGSKSMVLWDIESMVDQLNSEEGWVRKEIHEALMDKPILCSIG